MSDSTKFLLFATDLVDCTVIKAFDPVAIEYELGSCASWLHDQIENESMPIELAESIAAARYIGILLDCAPGAMINNLMEVDYDRYGLTMTVSERLVGSQCEPFCLMIVNDKPRMCITACSGDVESSFVIA